jgi:hypothetical protein
LACNGSGRYDHNGSPPCGSCGGTGWERQMRKASLEVAATWRDGLDRRTADIIEACAEAAVEMSANSVGPFTCEYLRSAVIAAGRRAAKRRP